MTIDIAYYLSELERFMGEVFESAKKAGIQGGVITKDQENILLTGALTAAKHASLRNRYTMRLSKKKDSRMGFLVMRCNYWRLH